MEYADEISNTEDTLDSRNIEERIEYLQADMTNLDEDENRELARLIDFRDNNHWDYETWKFGVVLIHESYFEDYAEEYAVDIGAISSDAPWPIWYIDWKAAAEALQMNYTGVDFDGETYYTSD